jgi:hypothetical protein
MNVAIDFTDVYYYGNKNDPMVIGTKAGRGTSRCHRYATIFILHDDCGFTLKCVQVDKDTLKHEVVAELIDYANKFININYVIMDKGFFTVNVISTLEKKQCKYLIPAVQNEKVVAEMSKYDVNSIIKYNLGSRLRSIATNLIILPPRKQDKKQEKRGFISNIDQMEIVSKFSKLYSTRWKIETAYRVSKNYFMAKTTSKNPIVRLFYFHFSICLYNLWQFVNLTISRFEGPIKKGYEIISEVFGESLVNSFRLLGAGPPNFNSDFMGLLFNRTHWYQKSTGNYQVEKHHIL